MATTTSTLDEIRDLILQLSDVRRNIRRDLEVQRRQTDLVYDLLNGRQQPAVNASPLSAPSHAGWPTPLNPNPGPPSFVPVAQSAPHTQPLSGPFAAGPTAPQFTRPFVEISQPVPFAANTDPFAPESAFPVGQFATMSNGGQFAPFPSPITHVAPNTAGQIPNPISAAAHLFEPFAASNAAQFVGPNAALFASPFAAFPDPVSFAAKTTQAVPFIANTSPSPFAGQANPTTGHSGSAAQFGRAVAPFARDAFGGFADPITAPPQAATFSVAPLSAPSQTGWPPPLHPSSGPPSFAPVVQPQVCHQQSWNVTAGSQFSPVAHASTAHQQNPRAATDPPFDPFASVAPPNTQIPAFAEIANPNSQFVAQANQPQFAAAGDSRGHEKFAGNAQPIGPFAAPSGLAAHLGPAVQFPGEARTCEFPSAPVVHPQSGQTSQAPPLSFPFANLQTQTGTVEPQFGRFAHAAAEAQVANPNPRDFSPVANSSHQQQIPSDTYQQWQPQDPFAPPQEMPPAHFVHGLQNPNAIPLGHRNGPPPLPPGPPLHRDQAPAHLLPQDLNQLVNFVPRGPPRPADNRIQFRAPPGQQPLQQVGHPTLPPPQFVGLPLAPPLGHPLRCKKSSRNIGILGAHQVFVEMPLRRFIGNAYPNQVCNINLLLGNCVFDPGIVESRLGSKLLPCGEIAIRKTIRKRFGRLLCCTLNRSRAVNYQTISPNDLAKSVLSQGGWSELMCAGKSSHQSLDIAIVFVGKELQSSDVTAKSIHKADLVHLLKASFTDSNSSMAFPYVEATNEMGKVENSILASFEESCEHGMGVGNVILTGSCSVDGKGYKKGAELDSIYDNLSATTTKENKGVVNSSILHQGKVITPEMLSFMKELRKVVPVGFVGESHFVKISEQLGKIVLDDNDYVFYENGLVAYKEGKLMGTQSLIPFALLPLVNLVFDPGIWPNEEVLWLLKVVLRSIGLFVFDPGIDDVTLWLHTTCPDFRLEDKAIVNGGEIDTARVSESGSTRDRSGLSSTEVLLGLMLIYFVFYF